MLYNVNSKKKKVFISLIYFLLLLILTDIRSYVSMSVTLVWFYFMWRCAQWTWIWHVIKFDYYYYYYDNFLYLHESNLKKKYLCQKTKQNYNTFPSIIKYCLKTFPLVATDITRSVVGFYFCFFVLMIWLFDLCIFFLFYAFSVLKFK